MVFCFLVLQKQPYWLFLNNCHNLDTIEIDTKEEMVDDKEYQKTCGQQTYRGFLASSGAVVWN
jgi:hypothetical protein